MVMLETDSFPGPRSERSSTGHKKKRLALYTALLPLGCGMAPRLRSDARGEGKERVCG